MWHYLGAGLYLGLGVLTFRIGCAKVCGWPCSHGIGCAKVCGWPCSHGIKVCGWPCSHGIGCSYLDSECGWPCSHL
jgi:hypothetical protein